MKPALSVVPGSFTIHRLGPGAALPDGLKNASPCWIARTSDLDLTGILAGIAGVLAAAEISLFALSTFDTDYVLVKVDALPRAVAVLREVGYPIR